MNQHYIPPKCLIFFSFFLFLVLSISAQEMLVGSYNIRYKNWNDSVQGNMWSKRCQVICDQVNFMAPVIFGTQEVLYSQLLDMHKALDGYDYIGIGRDDGKHGGEHEAIFTKKTNSNSLTTATSGSTRRPTSPLWVGTQPASVYALGASFQ